MAKSFTRSEKQSVCKSTGPSNAFKVGLKKPEPLPLTISDGLEERRRLMAEICSGTSLDKVSVELGFPARTLSNLVEIPEHYAEDTARNVFLPALHARFPDKVHSINGLEMWVCDLRPFSAHVIKNPHLKQKKREYRFAAAQLLRELRQASGVTSADVVASLHHPMLQRNLTRIEEPDLRLGTGVFYAALKVLPPFYAQRAAEKVKTYLPLADLLAAKLKL